MKMYARPVKLAFTLRADKSEEFRKISDPEKMAKIQAQAKKIKNIEVEGLPYGK